MRPQKAQLLIGLSHLFLIELKILLAGSETLVEARQAIGRAIASLLLVGLFGIAFEQRAKTGSTVSIKCLQLFP
jgi:hypothetical protein